jgi:hypothetical protein
MFNKMRELFFLVASILGVLVSLSANASGPCENECKVRSAFGNILVKGPDSAADQAINLFVQINRDNIKNCRNSCINETTHEGCSQCAKRTLTAEKLAQDRGQLAQFECPTPPGDAGCIALQQPVFNYNNVAPAQARAQALQSAVCAQTCKNRLPFEGMKVDKGKLEEARIFATQIGLEAVTACINGCLGKPESECNQCAKEQIADEDRQNLADQITAKFECTDPEQSTSQAIVESIIGAPPPLCGLLTGVQVTVQVAP